ncbi:response regulator, partial [bacterium]|nr:response regulator [bacterium]
MAKILIVDDEPSIRLTFRAFLEDDGHHVRAAESVEDAVAQLEAEAVDAVVSDILLERSSGIELLKIVQDRWPDTKVLLITGEPNVTTAANAVRLGAFDYLSKPLDGPTIRKSVVAALRMQELERENAELRARLADRRSASQASETESIRHLPALLIRARRNRHGWRLAQPPQGQLGAEIGREADATWETCVAALVDPTHREAFEEALAGPTDDNGLVHWEGRAVAEADGEPRWLCVTAHCTDTGNEREIEAIAVDVTHPHRRHARLTVQHRMRAVATLARGVSRQVGAPLRYLSGHLELLADMASEAQHP